MKSGPPWRLGRQRTLPFTRRPMLEVFAVTDCTAQLTWREAPEGTIEAVTDGEARPIGRGPGPGAGEMTGLRPDTRYRTEVSCDQQSLGCVELRTQAALEGRPLLKVATISDLHLGQTGFGMLKRSHHPEQPRSQDPIPLRCAKAAVAEATVWGAQLLVVKGDITDNGSAAQWEMFDDLLAGIDIEVLAVPGNHDVMARPDSLDGREELRRRGLYEGPVCRRDRGGISVTTVDSTVTGRNLGRLAHRIDDLCRAVDTGMPALVFTHHHLQHSRLPRLYPLGVTRRNTVPLLARLVEANSDLLMSSGHSHRNRAARHGSALVTEVSSTSDFPGVWAGYEVHADGVRQTVRRIADPACIAWNDSTAAVVAGIWGCWSPGRLKDRCVVHRWATAPSATVSADATGASSAESDG